MIRHFVGLQSLIYTLHQVLHHPHPHHHNHDHDHPHHHNHDQAWHELGLILLIVLITILVFSSLIFNFEQDGPSPERWWGKWWKNPYFQIDSWKAEVFYIGFQGFHGLHMVGLDDPHFSWLPPTTWGVSANISRLSHLPRALYQQMQTHSIPNHIHPLYNWPDCSKSSTCSCLQTMMGQLFCGLCALCGLFLLNIPSYIIVSRWRI